MQRDNIVRGKFKSKPRPADDRMKVLEHALRGSILLDETLRTAIRHHVKFLGVDHTATVIKMELESMKRKITRD